MEIVANGDLDHKLEHFSQTEFDRIAGIFNKMTGSLKRMMYELEIKCPPEREGEARTRDRHRDPAGDLSGFPSSGRGFGDRSQERSGEEVGGDYFDFLPVGKKGQKGFMIADARGRGSPERFT